MIVLYVEDDPEDRDLFKEALEVIAPYTTVFFANDGQHGLRTLDSVTPDYIFLDINMPEMPGTVFLEEVLVKRGIKTVPVIVFTTSNNYKDKQVCKKLGASDFITKPSTFQDLCQILKRYI